VFYFKSNLHMEIIAFNLQNCTNFVLFQETSLLEHQNPLRFGIYCGGSLCDVCNICQIRKRRGMKWWGRRKWTRLFAFSLTSSIGHVSFFTSPQHLSHSNPLACPPSLPFFHACLVSFYNISINSFPLNL